MKMRYISFTLGAFLGFLCGAMSMQVMASDENGEVVCLAKNIYFEAGNQPLAGKVAILRFRVQRSQGSRRRCSPLAIKTGILRFRVQPSQASRHPW